MDDSFAKLLIQLRSKKKLSLREASALVGISHTYLSALEKGDPRNGTFLIPSADVLFKLCQAYELNLTEIMSAYNFNSSSNNYFYIAKQLQMLRKTNIKRFQEIMDIVMSDI